MWTRVVRRTGAWFLLLGLAAGGCMEERMQSTTSLSGGGCAEMKRKMDQMAAEGRTEGQDYREVLDAYLGQNCQNR